MLPSLLLVIWTYGLLSAGAINEAPDTDRLIGTFGQWSPERIAWILLTTLVLALLLHPLQFATTQLLEGIGAGESAAFGQQRSALGSTAGT